MPTVSSSISSRETDDAGKPPADSIETPPPFLGSWRNVYLFVLAELAVTVLAFWLLMKWAS